MLKLLPAILFLLERKSVYRYNIIKERIDNPNAVFEDPVLLQHKSCGDENDYVIQTV